MPEIRRRGGFSDRNNIKPINKTMQFYDFDQDTRIKIHNAISRLLNICYDLFSYDFRAEEFISEYCCENLFNISITSSKCSYDYVIRLIQETIENNTYGDVLDVVEFICTDLLDAVLNKTEKTYFKKEYQFKKIMNHLFETEYVGYRFVNDIILPVTNNDEIDSIESASQSPYLSVNQSIIKASSYLSEKNKDYENSIKESITALETLCSIITKNEKGTLGQLIDEIEKTKHIHPALKDAISKLYGFASDAPGIRHGGTESNADIRFEDAKLVLLICSSLINYFIETII